MNLQKRVAKGAELLDAHGEWANLVNVETLQMALCCKCVLHDVYQTKLDIEHDAPVYNEALTILGLANNEGFTTGDDFQYGFDCEANDPDYMNWEDYWKDEIASRLEVK